MKRILSYWLDRGRQTIFLLLLTSTVIQFIFNDSNSGALINIIFQFGISWLISIGADTIYQKVGHMKLWIYFYLLIITMTLIGLLAFPNYAGLR